MQRLSKPEKVTIAPQSQGAHNAEIKTKKNILGIKQTNNLGIMSLVHLNSLNILINLEISVQDSSTNFEVKSLSKKA